MKQYHLSNTPASARKLLPILEKLPIAENDRAFLQGRANQRQYPDTPLGHAAETVSDWSGRACLIGSSDIRKAAIMAQTRYPLLIITSTHRLEEWVMDLTHYFPDDECSFIGDDAQFGDKVYISTLNQAVHGDIWETVQPRSAIVDTYAIPGVAPSTVRDRLKDYADEIRSFTALVYDEAFISLPKFPLLTSLMTKGEVLNTVRYILYGKDWPRKVIAQTVKRHLASTGFNTSLSSLPDSKTFIVAQGASKRHNSPVTACSLIPTNVTVDIPTPSVSASYGVWEAFWTDVMDEVEITINGSQMISNHYLHSSHKSVVRHQTDNKARAGDVRKLPAYARKAITAISLLHPPTSVQEMEELLILCEENGWVLVDESPECRSMCALWNALRKALPDREF